MKAKLLTLISLVAFAVYSYVVPNDKIAFRVKVLEERTETPLVNVPVTAVFTDVPMVWGGQSVDRKEKKLTDANGVCRFTGSSNNAWAGYVVEKQSGFYATPWRSYVATNRVRHILTYRCEPYDCVYTTVLQRVEHPVALFVKQFNVGGSDSVRVDLFAKGNGCLQLDMLKGEWLPPVGNCEHADVIFTRIPRRDLGTGTNARGITAAAYRDSMSVKFVGDDNGFVEVASLANSGLRIRSAPENGYRHDYVCWKERTKNLKLVSSFDAERNFAFRIRAKRDKNGRITSAYYGKIYGDICFKKLIGVDVEAVAAPSFLYYLNPTPLDRNLEWDMKNNLCPNPGMVGRQP